MSYPSPQTPSPASRRLIYGLPTAAIVAGATYVGNRIIGDVSQQAMDWVSNQAQSSLTSLGDYVFTEGRRVVKRGYEQYLSSSKKKKSNPTPIGMSHNLNVSHGAVVSKGKGHKLSSHSIYGVICEYHKAAVAATGVGVNNGLYINSCSTPLILQQRVGILAMTKTLMERSFGWVCNDINDPMINVAMSGAGQPNTLPPFCIPTGGTTNSAFDLVGISISFRDVSTGTNITESAKAWYVSGSSWLIFADAVNTMFTAITNSGIDQFGEVWGFNIYLGQSGGAPANYISLYTSFLASEFTIDWTSEAVLNLQNRTVSVSGSSSTDVIDTNPLNMLRIMGNGNALVPKSRRNLALETYVPNQTDGVSFFDVSNDPQVASTPRSGDFRNTMGLSTIVFAPGAIAELPLVASGHHSLGKWLLGTYNHSGDNTAKESTVGVCQSIYIDKVMEISAATTITVAYEHHVKIGCSVGYKQSSYTKAHILNFA